MVAVFDAKAVKKEMHGWLATTSPTATADDKKKFVAKVDNVRSAVRGTGKNTPDNQAKMVKRFGDLSRGAGILAQFEGEWDTLARTTQATQAAKKAAAQKKRRKAEEPTGGGVGADEQAGEVAKKKKKKTKTTRGGAKAAQDPAPPPTA